MWQDQAEFNKQEVTRILARPVRFTDGDGYENVIWAAATHDKYGWLGWVEFREKIVNRWFLSEYTLKVVAGDLRINSPIETYNPAFGCVVGYLKWYDDVLVMIYTENHLVYACVLHISGEVRFTKICRLGDEWGVYGNLLVFRYRGETHVTRQILPSLEILSPMAQAEALAANLLRRVE